MASATHNIVFICRFCLSQEEDLLYPFLKASDELPSLEDVERFTGISINRAESASYAICIDCLDKLKASAEYRNACISNDDHFNELFAVVLASADVENNDTVETIALSEDDEDTMDIEEHENNPNESCLSQFLRNRNLSVKVENQKKYIVKNDITSSKKATISPPSKKATLVSDSYSIGYDPLDDTCMSDNVQMEEVHNSSVGSITPPPITLPRRRGRPPKNVQRPTPVKKKDRYQSYCTKKTAILAKEDNFDYSANFIMPGEMCDSETEQRDGYHEWSTFYPFIAQDAPIKQERGVRRLHLCDICGKFTKHLSNHLLMHQSIIMRQCPYCPVKMPQKNSMLSHINTVHLKKISKTCDICGKGFVHHKTYRYHMLVHKDEGKTFECKACEKTFPHSIALRDHYNRLHNFARKGKQRLEESLNSASDAAHNASD
uniref:ZAD domain-containing protein n=1 Tax=Anopheles dirus TaxID=7168 RepID=A0A182NPK3_9DIPT